MGMTLLAGTSIVLLMTATELWIAADSRIIAIDQHVRTVESECKIQPIGGGVFYAQAGLLKDKAGHFDAASVAKRAAAANSSVLGAASEFEVRIAGPLISIVAELRGVNPGYFRSKIVGKRTLDVAFFGFDGGSPRIAVRSFTMYEREDGSLRTSVKRLDCPGNCPTGMTWAMLGEDEAINQFLDKNPRFLSKNGFKATLQKLIEVEARAKPDLVSLPVDILRISALGPEWVIAKSTCPSL